MIEHNRQISISDLTAHPINQLQGKLAAENLERIIQGQTVRGRTVRGRTVRGGTVRLDLDSVPYALGSTTDPPDSVIGQINPDPRAMTPNFLHGLTGYIIRKQLLDQVIFSSANPHARRQIALLSAQKGCQASIQDPGPPFGENDHRKKMLPSPTRM